MTDDRIVPCPSCGLPQDGPYGDDLWKDYEAHEAEVKHLRDKLANIRKFLTLPDTRSSMQVTMALCEIDGIE
jgi:hypothetical protein